MGEREGAGDRRGGSGGAGRKLVTLFFSQRRGATRRAQRDLGWLESLRSASFVS